MLRRLSQDGHETASSDSTRSGWGARRRFEGTFENWERFCSGKNKSRDPGPNQGQRPNTLVTGKEPDEDSREHHPRTNSRTTRAQTRAQNDGSALRQNARDVKRARGPIQYSTAQHSTIKSTVQYGTVQHSRFHSSRVQHSTIQCSTAQYNTAQPNTVQLHTLQFNTVQYNKLQYSEKKIQGSI